MYSEGLPLWSNSNLDDRGGYFPTKFNVRKFSDGEENAIHTQHTKGRQSCSHRASDLAGNMEELKAIESSRCAGAAQPEYHPPLRHSVAV